MRTGSLPSAPTPSASLAALLARRGVRSREARPALLQPARATVTFTFDGFPRSAARAGAAIVENVGGRATFFACAGLAGSASAAGPMFDADDVGRLLGAGHEIGCATYSELNCARAKADAVLADMVRNADALSAMGMEDRLVSFAYPSGDAGGTLKRQLPARFTSARGQHRGLASGKADLAQLRAFAMGGPGALQRCMTALEDARRRRGWVIFHARDVSARPSPLGVASGALERLCGAAFASGMRILPVRAALAATQAEARS